MTCVECGKEGTYWLCSNACALAYAKARGKRDCAICSYDPKTGRVGRHDTNKICAECRNHMENAEWCSGRKELADERAATRDEGCRRLREEQDRPLPEVSETLTRIARLLVEGARAPVVYRDKRGRRRGKRERWRALSMREIAARAGCSRSEVARVVRHLESGMSWPVLDGGGCTSESGKASQAHEIDRDCGERVERGAGSAKRTNG
jgi:AraC-like DNA-binding protein